MLAPGRADELVRLIPYHAASVASRNASISSSENGEDRQQIRRVGCPSLSGMRAKKAVSDPSTRLPHAAYGSSHAATRCICATSSNRSSPMVGWRSSMVIGGGAASQLWRRH